MRPFPALAVIAAAALSLTACCGGARVQAMKTHPAAPAAPAGTHDLLANGLADWRSYGSDHLEGTGWSVSNGILHLPAFSDSPDLVTKCAYGDFDLSFEYLCPDNGIGSNSGVMYRVSEDAREPWWNGVEFQVLGTAYRCEGDPADAEHAAGSVYGFYPTRMDLIKPDGQWNTGRIVAKGTRIQHWLNGVKVAEYDTAGADYAQKWRESKFKIRQGFGQNAAGVIDLQNHMDEVFYRHIRITPLK